LELRPYVDILRRRIRFILLAVIVATAVAGLGSTLRTPEYRASTRVWLQPNKAAEQLNPVQAAASDPTRFAAAQIDIVESEAVARRAAERLPGLTAEDVEDSISVTGAAGSDVLTITAVAEVPRQARDLANAVAESYIENRRESAVAGLQQAAKDIDDKIANVQSSIADLDRQLAALPADAPGRDALRAAREAATTQYQTLYARQQELAVNVSLQRGGAEIIAPARTPTSRSSPKPLRDAMLGGLVGLVLSGGIVLLREQLDDHIRSGRDVERGLGLAVLAELPFDQESTEDTASVATMARPQSFLSEAVRSLRTSINFMAVDEPAKVVVVTSALPGEGKSVVSANLAAACAQAGQRTILVGADLRRSGVSKLFDVGGDALGLTDALLSLHDGTKPGDQPLPRPKRDDDWPGVSKLFVRPMPNLLFLPAGTVPPNPAELLGSRRMQELLTHFAAEADVVVIDTPPLLPVTDAAVLAAQADGTILVVAMDDTRLPAAQKAKAVLDGTKAKILGVVINKAPQSAVPHYYAGYYAEAPATTNGSGEGGHGRNGRSGRRRGWLTSRR
jgi:Mrp family chromosome partitioning ATPase/capsular polysaccharide biosynthesis protein